MVLAIYLSAQFRQPFLKLCFWSFWRGREAKTKEKVAIFKQTDWNASVRRCWTRSEGHHGEKIKNGSFASDLRSVHISRYAIKLPGEIVWYGHYRSSSAFKGHNMRCSFEIFLREGGRNRRLLLASQNCYVEEIDFGIEATRYVSTRRSYMCLKCLILNVRFSLALFSPQIFFPGTLTCARMILIFSSKIMCNLFWFSRRSWSARQKVEFSFANLFNSKLVEVFYSF